MTKKSDGVYYCPGDELPYKVASVKAARELAKIDGYPFACVMTRTDRLGRSRTDVSGATRRFHGRKDLLLNGGSLVEKYVKL